MMRGRILSLLICGVLALASMGQDSVRLEKLKALVKEKQHEAAITEGNQLLEEIPPEATTSLAKVHLELATAHLFSQAESEATRHAQQALNLSSASADTLTMMRATRLLAELLFAANRYADALGMEREGERLALASGDKDLRIKFLGGIADNFVMLGMADSAERYYRRTLAGLAPDDVRQRSITESNLAKLLSERGEHSAAIALMQETVGRLKTLDEGKYAKALNTLAYIYHRAGRHREAVAHFSESERLNQLTEKDISTTLENLGFTAESQAALGEHAAAYATMLQLEEVLHAYYARTANEEILALEKRFETERTEKENALLRAENEERRLNEERLRARWIAAAALVTLLAGLLALLYRNYLMRGQHARDMQRINDELQDQRDRVQRMNDLLELKVLRAQLNPHFIHNCQNSAIALVKEGREQEALTYLQGLSKLMRAVLEQSVMDRITLEAELDFLRQYLQLEALRLPDLRYQVEADGELLNDETLLPALLVQPFVENAIWHGLANKQGEREVQVRFTATKDGLRCTIEDNGVGRQSAAGRAEGDRSYATELTQERLLLLTHRMQQKGSIVIHDRRDDAGRPAGTEVVLELVL